MLYDTSVGGIVHCESVILQRDLFNELCHYSRWNRDASSFCRLLRLVLRILIQGFGSRAICSQDSVTDHLLAKKGCSIRPPRTQLIILIYGLISELMFTHQVSPDQVNVAGMWTD